MTFEPATVLLELRERRLVDPGRLKSGGRHEIEAALDRWRKDGLTAYVLILLPEVPPSEARPLWDMLALDSQRDLLLVANGHAWEARGWGLASADAETALAKAAPELQRYLGRGLAAALDALGEAARAHALPAPSGSGSSALLPIVGGTTGVVVVGLFGLAIYRRNQRMREARIAFDAARASAERAFSEVVLGSDALAGQAGTDLQLRAGELKRQLDKLVAGADGRLAKMSSPVVLGAILQLENELTGLRSTSLQRERSAKP